MGLSAGESAERINAAQRAAMAANRLGIPVLFHGEGAAYDGRTAARDRAGRVVGSGVGARNPCGDRARGARTRCPPRSRTGTRDRAGSTPGRVRGTFGEDPYLVSEMGVAAIEGLQGVGMPRLVAPDKVLAAARHLAGEGPPAEGATTGPAPLSERELREVHLVAFEETIRRTGVAAVVVARNDIDAVPSHANKWLLNDVLRGEWSYRGVILGDPDGVAELASVYHVAGTRADAALLAFEAGVDADLSETGAFDSLAERAGRIDPARIDAAVARLLELKFRAGLFEKPYADAPDGAARNRDTRTRTVAAKAARRAITLLKNDGAVLPLSIPAGRNRPAIAVIELGDARVLEAIRAKVHGRAQIATEAAQDSEFVILAIGETDRDGEARDRLESLQVLGKRVIVVLLGNRPAVNAGGCATRQRAHRRLGARAYGAMPRSPTCSSAT